MHAEVTYGARIFPAFAQFSTVRNLSELKFLWQISFFDALSASVLQVEDYVLYARLGAYLKWEPAIAYFMPVLNFLDLIETSRKIWANLQLGID